MYVVVRYADIVRTCDIISITPPPKTSDFFILPVCSSLLQLRGKCSKMDR